MNKFNLSIISDIKIAASRLLILGLFCLLHNCSLQAQNLLYNGNFEYGASGNGFVSTASYNYLSTVNGSTNAGDWAISTNPQLVNSGFISGTDHSGTGNMMVIDGSTTGGQQRFWKAGNTGGGIIGFVTGTSYTFSYWIQSIATSVVDASTSANIGVQFNNVSNVTLTNGNAQAPLPANGWQQVKYTFIATGSTVNIEMYDNNTALFGNDFAIDDIELTGPPQPLSFSYSIANPTCPNLSDGSIVAYGTGGIAPYTYSFDGGAFSAVNVLTGLTTSSHSFTIQDASLNTVSSPIINIVSPIDSLTSGASLTAICSGHSTTLSSTGAGNNGYTWVAVPPDPSLTTPNISNPTVSPNITTTYIVSTSSTVTTNLVFNGDFSAGNNGFSTDYLYRVTNPTGGQRTYGITPNPQTFYPVFSTCGDHTTGTGNMLVADGSINPTDRLWSQTVPVKPFTTYTFTYWIQSVTSSSPARIETRINGIALPAGSSANPFTVPATSACGNWQQVTYSWTAGVGENSAELSLYDKNFADIGNDFAIDDISFITTTTSCTLVDSVKIDVTTTTSPVTGFSYTPNAVCVGSLTNPVLSNDAGFTSGGKYTVSPSGLTIDSTTGAIDITTSAAGIYTVTYTSPVLGCRLAGSSSFTFAINQPSIADTFATACNSYTWRGNTYTSSNNYIAHINNVLGCDSAITLHLTINQPSTADTFATACDSYTWRGNTYTSTNNYLAHINNAAGCDSAITLHLIINQPSTADTFATACNSYTWRGNTYTSSNNYIAHINNALGCDSAITLHLIINQPSTADTFATACNSYTWRGNTYTSTNNYLAHINNVLGCDSAITLHLTINQPSTADTFATACNSYTWRGNTYTSSNNYIAHINNALGCDSAITLHLTINQPSTADTFATACNSYTWRGNTYTSSNNYIAHINNAVGCDSAITLHLIINQPSTADTFATACNSYTWRGNTYTSSNNYIAHINNAVGCDSAITLHLIINQPSIADTFATACDSYTWRGNTYTSSNNYIAHINNAAGCDSAITLHLIINQPSTADTFATACDSYTWRGNTYTSSNNYIAHINNVLGCDSAITLHLTINQPSTADTFATACNSYTWRGNTYISSNNYIAHINNALGCDSAITLHLTINQPSTADTFATACNSYTWRGNTYTSSNNYIAHINNALGCDSAITLHLTINQPSTADTFATACNSYTWRGNTYTSSNNYIAHINNALGCDSAITLHLTINQPSTADTFATACNSYTWRGNTYTSSNNYIAHINNALGCDSAITLHLTINQPSTADTFATACNSFTWRGTTYTSSNNYVAHINNVLGCDSAITLHLTINQFNPLLNASVTNQPNCDIPTGTITISSPVGANMEYSIGGAYQATTSFTGLASGVYSVTVKDISSGCVSPAISLTVNPKTGPPPTPIASATVQPDCVTPTGTIVVSFPIVSNPNLRYSVGGAYQKGLTFTGLVPGVYPVTVKDTTTGCISSVFNVTVNAIAYPSASISYPGNPFTNTGTATVIVSTSSVITSSTYSSSPAGLSLDANTGTINLTASNIGTYSIKYVYYSGTCVDSTNTTVTINPSNTSVFIPNAFSPNGDGKNDILYVLGNTIKTLNMKIFNQWGEMIFASSNQSYGWDGRHGGKLQPVGVYMYIAQIVLQDGTVLNKHGSINLVR